MGTSVGPTIWGIHAGRTGDAHTLFLQRGVIAIGWKAMGDLSAIPANRDAFIYPYRGPGTNHVCNGLLLRSDLHTLFDLGLIGIDSEDYTIVIAESLRQTSYGDLAGKRVRLPAHSALCPNRDLLERHRRESHL
jgi:predicted restriction endonuclease